jgi:hypothetical protein
VAVENISSEIEAGIFQVEIEVVEERSRWSESRTLERAT